MQDYNSILCPECYLFSKLSIKLYVCKKCGYDKSNNIYCNNCIKTVLVCRSCCANTKSSDDYVKTLIELYVKWIITYRNLKNSNNVFNVHGVYNRLCKIYNTIKEIENKNYNEVIKILKEFAKRKTLSVLKN